ncbi:MAG: hypothetical protein ACYC2G_16640 [Gemmatimonadaceae bacterium]
MNNTPMITLSLARRLLAALVLVAASTTAAVAQPDGTPESRLAGRLDVTTRSAVLAQVDSARRAGLPVGPLVDRALEGASKRELGRPVSGADSVGAVRRLRGALGTARASLGARASATELAAGASALQANVGASALVAIGNARSSGSLTVPLSVLTDLVALGVPSETAARTVLSLARADDGVLLAYQRDVERDIGVGALPAVAASVRAAGLERTGVESLNSPAVGGIPPTTIDAGKPRPPRKP